MKGRMKIVKIFSSYAKFWKILEKCQSDRKFMKAECAYTVPRELGSKNVILLWGFHHTLFSVTLCLLVATEKLPARAVWRTICWSYLMTTCRSIVTIHFMNCRDWFSQIYQKRHRNILKTECNFIYWYLCSYLCSLFKKLHGWS